jgi:hypothetical protein
MLFARKEFKNLFKNAWRNNLAKSVETSFWMHFATTTSLHFSNQRIFRTIFCRCIDQYCRGRYRFFLIKEKDFSDFEFKVPSYVGKGTKNKSKPFFLQ